MIKKYIVLFILIVAGSLNNGIYAQVKLELQTKGFYNTQINVDKYPQFSTILRASDNGNFVPLSKEQIIVLEDNYPIVPSSVTPPDTGGWQVVKWNTSLLSKTDTGNGALSTMLIFATFNNKSAGAVATYRLPSVSIVSLLDLNDDFLYEMNMGAVIVGDSKTRSLKIWPQSARIHNNRELSFSVDSITIDNPQFKYFDVDGPPFMLTSPFTHDAIIIFRPANYGYVRGKLSIFYDGGRKTILPLIGGNFKIDKKTNLNVLQPNGGELLTPCEVYEIKWSGSVKGLFTKIEYSTDAGNTWKEIAYVADSSYMWTVPPDISNTVYIKVSQPLQKNNSRNLQVDNIPVTRIAFDSRGYNLLAANSSGMIYEWDLTDYTLKNSFSIGNVNYPGEKIDPKGLLYFDDNKKFVTAYNRFFMYPANNPDTLAFFNAGTKDPYLLVPVNVSVKDIYTDSKRQFIAVLPKFDNKIYLYSYEDGSFIKTVDFDHPIAAMNFSKTDDKAVVVLYNNDILLLDVPNFNTTKKFNFPELPQVTKAQISPNGKFIGVGCLLQRYQEYTGNRNQTHLIDIASSQIVRTMRISSSNPVNIDFSPTSNFLIAGNEGQPQIALWDLPKDDYSGSIQGNSGVLTDLQVSPNGNEIATTSFSDDNLTIKSFTYPESDKSDGPFKILRPDVSVDTVLIQPHYIGMDNPIHITKKLCNNGLVPIIIDFAKFESGEHFRLVTAIETDTVQPGTCIDFDIVFHPLDTGLIKDTLVFYSCSGEFRIPFEARSLPRNISFFTEPIDFGELCVGETKRKDVLFAKNNDPVPLKINIIYIDKLSESDFVILNTPKDTIIPPGGTINLQIEFLPSSVGAKKSDILLQYSDLPYYKSKAHVIGIGIGTEIQTSHEDLRFIPEILNRKLLVTNLSNNDITIVQTDIYPYKNFSLLTPLPQSIPAKGTLELDIEWNGTVAPPDTMHILAEPCVNRTIVLLGAYSATSFLTIPTVEADPNGDEGDAVINIKYKTSTEHPYNGTCFFESEISINPRIFLPLEVTSSYGTGTLTKNEIVDDRRIIGFRIEGDFPQEGVVANIRGVAGLAETDTSIIRFQLGTSNWGKAVNTTWNDGLFRLINLCGNRRILQRGKTLADLILNPNPASSSFNVQFTSKQSGTAILEVMNNLGQILIKVENLPIVKGQNKTNISAGILTPGTYNVIVRSNIDFISKQLIIIK